MMIKNTLRKWLGLETLETYIANLSLAEGRLRDEIDPRLGDLLVGQQEIDTRLVEVEGSLDGLEEDARQGNLLDYSVLAASLEEHDLLDKVAEACAENFDVSDVSIDMEDLAEHISYSALAREFDTSEMEIEYDELANSVCYSELSQNIDEGELIDHLNVDMGEIGTHIVDGLDPGCSTLQAIVGRALSRVLNESDLRDLIKEGVTQLDLAQIIGECDQSAWRSMTNRAADGVLEAVERKFRYYMQQIVPVLKEVAEAQNPAA